MAATTSSRLVLQRVATHILSRARVAGAGQLSLRITPGGFGTPSFGPHSRRVRLANGRLVVETETDAQSLARSMPIAGSTLRELADFAEVDLGAALFVGHDAPELGDIDEPISFDGNDVASITQWYRDVADMLDLVLAALPADADSTPARLWPEHFDVAVDASVRPDLRVNLGGSPGDGYSEEPYLYVGPWTGDRPGDPGFWNAPFGAVVTRAELVAAGGDAGVVAAGTAFLLDGYGRLL
jgi:hypothetical protein